MILIQKLIETKQRTFLKKVKALSKDISFSNPITILPNEDIQSFELSDLDGDGRQEIVYLTSNGELKYASQGHYIDESSRDLLRSTDWAVDGHTDVTLRFSDSGYLILKMGAGQGTNLRLKDGTFTGSSGRGDHYILIDHISDTEISGKFTCHQFGIYGEVPFTATPE